MIWKYAPRVGFLPHQTRRDFYGWLLNTSHQLFEFLSNCCSVCFYLFFNCNNNNYYYNICKETLARNHTWKLISFLNLFYCGWTIFVNIHEFMKLFFVCQPTIFSSPLYCIWKEAFVDMLMIWPHPNWCMFVWLIADFHCVRKVRRSFFMLIETPMFTLGSVGTSEHTPCFWQPKNKWVDDSMKDPLVNTQHDP